MAAKNLFDGWVDHYDRWFETPIGRLVRDYERKLILELLAPSAGEIILDAGCGSGVFTRDILDSGATVVGLDISLPMIGHARKKMERFSFFGVKGTMMQLPFGDNTFNRAVSVTAIEFVTDGSAAVNEMFRVTRPGGCVVVATLNSLSLWAVRRKKKAETTGHPLFENVVFRSPDEVRVLAAGEGLVKTAIHFQKTDDPAVARRLERQGQLAGSNTGAFIIARWIKPDSG